jgi:hypothetical protein
MTKIFKSADKKEEKIKNISFKNYKFNNRPKPDKKNILIVTCFSEFGCESLGINYCIPKLLQSYPGKYVIAVGWYGRAYLYRHLVDEYWEINEENMWLRDYTRAFHHDSKNLESIEQKLQEHGNVYSSRYFGSFCLGNSCLTCKHQWGGSEYVEDCPMCKTNNLQRALFADILFWKKTMVQVPRPSTKKMNYVKQYLKPNSVGIFARGRTTYGRNLSSDFYVGLIKKLEYLGYNPIWMGEKQSTLACPVDHIVDFSRMEESRDLELTLSIISQLQFTIQFYTASTRLAAMMGVPFILFESPDQIVGFGQEGMRLALTSQVDKKKLVLAHFIDVNSNSDKTIELVEQAINEINQDNWSTIFAMLENEWMTKLLYKNKNYWGEDVAN